LGFLGQDSLEGDEVSKDVVLEILTDDDVCEGLTHSLHDLITTPQGEPQTIAFTAVVACENHVDAAVIGILVNCIRPI